MNLRQRLDELRTLAEKADKGKWEGADYWVNADFIDAMRNAIGPLLEVVEAQHRALEALLVERSGMPKECGHFYECRCAHDAARAALSLMDKEL